MISLFGLLVMAPLTLWRLPTFIIVFKIHRSKRFFFKVLFTVYKLMLYDILTFVFHIFALLVSPISYCKFRYGTAFKYGSEGVT